MAKPEKEDSLLRRIGHGIGNAFKPEVVHHSIPETKKTRDASSTTQPLAGASSTSNGGSLAVDRTDISSKDKTPAADPAGAPEANNEKYELDQFRLLNVTPGAGLAGAEERLKQAFEKLEVVLQKKRSSEKYALDLQDITEVDEDSLESTYSFSEIVTELQKYHDESQEKKHVKVGKFVAACVPTTKLLLNVTGTVAKNVGVMAPAGIAANGLTQIIDIAMAPQTLAGEVLSGLDLSLRDQYLIQQLEVLPSDAINEDILRRSLDTQTALIDFLRIGLEWLQSMYVYKIAQTTAGVEKVQSSKKTLQAARDALRISISDDFYLSYKRKALEDRQEKELDNVCPYTEYLRPLSRQRTELHVQRLANTALGILQDGSYKRWGEGGHSTLWCTGLAGAGKTFAASAVIDNLELYIRQKKNVGLAYYFCSFTQRKAQSRESKGSVQTRESVLGNLTRQLIARKKGPLKRFKIHGDLPTYEERKKLFKDTLSLFSEVYIVLDAVDEFSTEHDSRITLIEDLVTLTKDSKCYLCITSRRDDVILNLLPNSVEVTVRASKPEIEKYVEYRLLKDESNSHAKRIAKQDETLLKDLSNGILEKSDRIFRLAELQLSEVLREDTADAVREKLKHLTSDINDYYEKTMERINASSKKDALLKLLTWVVLSGETLNVGEMRVALGTLPDHIDTKTAGKTGRWLNPHIDNYVSACEGLLAVQKKRQWNSWLDDESDLRTVTLEHETVDQYFRDHQNKLVQTPNCMILDHCMRFLQSLGLRLIPLHSQHWSSIDPGSLARLLVRSTDVELEMSEDEFKYRLDTEYADWEKEEQLTWMLAYDTSRTDDQVSEVLQVAMFTRIADHWGRFVEDAIKEDKSAIAKINHFLKAFDEAREGPQRHEHGNSLHYCADKDWSIPFQLRIDDGVDPNMDTDTFGRSTKAIGIPNETPLGIALHASSWKVARILVKDRRVDPNVRSGTFGETPLTWCASKASNDENAMSIALQLLAREDIKVNQPNGSHRTPLVEALEVRNRTLVDALLQHPAFNFQDNAFESESSVRAAMS